MVGLGALAGCGDAFTRADGAIDGDAGPPTDGAVASDATHDASEDAGLDATATDGSPGDDGATGSDGSGMGDATSGCGATPCQSGFDCELGVCVDRAPVHFSATSNPSGNWTYGSSTSVGGALVTYPLHEVMNGSLDVWNQTPGSLAPSVFYNDSNSTGGASGFTMAAKSLGFAPVAPPALSTAPPSPDSALRWTCPASGTYAIDATFTGLAPDGGTTVAIQVIIQDQAVGSNNGGFLNAYGEPNTFTFSQPAMVLDTGERVDFYVIAAPSSMWSSGYTGIEAHITGR